MIASPGPAVAVDAAALERVGIALADATRRRLLLALLEGPAFPADLAERLGLTRGNVSNHLACLRGCGLVRTTSMGRRVRYELVDPRLAHALADLAGLVLLVDHEVESPCETGAGCCPPVAAPDAETQGASEGA
ncbi:MAG: metalloregulator ArsR/SmtB family transcription factor [Streptosporangiales bacterium]|nr:metalloregulator ArsR/SmtB family transcription factor [Streptosporangiales bacterium]